MILNLEHIYKDYQQDKLVVPVLKDVCLQVEEGEYVAIMGPSGSGKTTLMNIIGCLDQPTSGVYEFSGENILSYKDRELAAVRSKSIGFVFQNFQLLPRATALDNVALPLSYAGVKPKERKERAFVALERVGLADRAEFRPNQLSGGQKQRVAIAGILAMEPKCIVLDEPTAMLDPKGREEVLEAVTKLRAEQGISIVLITHYMQEATLADRIIVMDSGKILTQGTPKEVFSETELLLSHSLSVPQSSELIYKLKKAGFELPDGIVSDDECVNELVKLIKGV